MDEWVTNLTNSIATENKRDIKTITVHFLDSYKIPIAVNPHETTAEDVSNDYQTSLNVCVTDVVSGLVGCLRNIKPRTRG